MGLDSPGVNGSASYLYALREALYKCRDIV